MIKAGNFSEIKITAVVLKKMAWRLSCLAIKLVISLKNAKNITAVIFVKVYMPAI